MIVDVLLKYFYRDVYDKECCNKNCKDCPDGNFAECEEANSNKSATHEILAKLFKSSGGEAETGDIVVDGKKLPKGKLDRFAAAFKTAISDLEKTLNK